MKIRSHSKFEDQYSKVGKFSWRVQRLVDLSKNFKVINASLDCMNVYNTYENLSLRDMAMHIKAVNNASLDFPIILDEDGEIMDGRHRIIKALVLGNKTIKAVRFDENPDPCSTEDD